MSDLPVSGGQWVGFDIEEALTRADYDPNVYPLPEPARGTRGPGEPVADPWEDRAAGRGLTDLMYPGNDHHGQAKARAICASCPVVEECLDYALGLPVVMVRQGGIFAGRGRAELERERRARRAVA